MAVYTPTIIVSSTPGITVTMPGRLTFSEFINSLGNFVYRVFSFQLTAQTIAQLQQPINYNIFDSSGVQYGVPTIMNVDPFQFTAAIVQDNRQQPFVLNGRSAITFLLLAGENLQFILGTDQVSNTDAFDQVNMDSNYDRTTDSLGNLKLYNSFKDTL